MSLFNTTIAGSLPKLTWLAEPDKLWAPQKGVTQKSTRKGSHQKGVRSQYCSVR